MKSDLHNLTLALQSHFPIIIFETHDEPLVEHLLNRALAKINKPMTLSIWSAAGSSSNKMRKPKINYGVESLDYHGVESDEDDPEAFLQTVAERYKNKVVLLPDFQKFLTNPKILRLVREIGHAFYEKNIFLVFVSHRFDTPEEIARLAAHIELSLPSKNEIMQFIRDEAKVWALKTGAKPEADRKAVDLITQHLVGLTASDAKRMIRAAVHDDGIINAEDVAEMIELKHRFLAGDSAVSFEFDTANFADMGGFDALFEWLGRRKDFFMAEQDVDALDIPKGILLLGVQGCGKSLAAKAIAGEWGIPLLKFDVAALYNKYIGETEKNLRNVLKAAEKLSPCVLWIDEIEKAMGQSGGDETGTSTRILGTLLTWMAENTSRVFLVATANDVTKLPPELMRKGRIDELFFVDLPNEKSRESIFKVHLNKRNIPFDTSALSPLVEASDGFSGAEIEQAVASARYLSSSLKEKTHSKHVLQEVKVTKSLSLVRKEEIQALRAWALERCVLI